MSFKIGQKVVCISGVFKNESSIPSCFPVLNKAYEINYITDGYTDGPYLGLTELSQDACYRHDGFRPLDEHFAESVLEKVCEEINQEQLIEA